MLFRGKFHINIQPTLPDALITKSCFGIWRERQYNRREIERQERRCIRLIKPVNDHGGKGDLPVTVIRYIFTSKV